MFRTYCPSKPIVPHYVNSLWAPYKHITKSCLLPRKAYFLIYSFFEQLLSTINLKRLLSVNNPLEFSLKQALTCTCSRVFTLEWFTLVLTLHPVPASVIKAGVYRGKEGQGSRQWYFLRIVSQFCLTLKVRDFLNQK